MLNVKAFPALACASLLLGGCAATVPTAPAVLALPPQGKALVQFQQEDSSCRQYATQRIFPNAAPTQTGAASANPSTQQLQQRYDVAYAQCMAANGNRLQQFPIGYYEPAAYAYGDPFYDTYYGPWAGPAFGVDFVGGFGPGFDHRGFHHVGFIHHAGAFHGGGGHHR